MGVHSSWYTCQKCGEKDHIRKRREIDRWRTPTVLAIAQRAYSEADWASLPILADALEEAGCDALDLLLHLRGRERCPRCLGKGRISRPPGKGAAALDRQCADCEGFGTVALRGPHVRGCHVIDLILGKE